MKKEMKNSIVSENVNWAGNKGKSMYLCTSQRDVRVAEGARLESV